MRTCIDWDRPHGRSLSSFQVAHDGGFIPFPLSHAQRATGERVPRAGGGSMTRPGHVDWNEVAQAGGVPKPTRAGRAARRLQSRKPMPKRNEERHADRVAMKFGPQAEACRRLPCVACGHEPTPERPNDPHHEPPDTTDAETVPLCRACHTRRHTVGEVKFWNDLQLHPADVQDAVREYMHSPAAWRGWGSRP